MAADDAHPTTQPEDHPEEHPGRLPRDGRDQPQEDRPVEDRPGDAGLSGMRVRDDGQVVPAPPEPSEAPDQDPVIEERRQRAADQPDGDAS